MGGNWRLRRGCRVSGVRCQVSGVRCQVSCRESQARSGPHRTSNAQPPRGRGADGAVVATSRGLVPSVPETTSGVANRLPPHDDELVLEECPSEALAPAPPVGMFKAGEDYPYWAVGRD